MSSLQRLIDLAKRTGDRLIIHQPEDRDLVIMDIDAYEQMIDRIEDCDILHEEDYFDHDPYDFDPAHSEDEWESISDVLEQLKQQGAQGATSPLDPAYFAFGDNDIGREAGSPVSWQEDTPAPDAHFVPPTPPPADAPKVPYAETPEPTEPELHVPEGQESEPIPSQLDEITNIPLREGTDDLEWEEEPLEDSDEPTFYEEPV